MADFLLFFDISTSELLVILIVVFLIFGPKKLPEMARKVGRVLNELRKATDEIKNEIKKETTDIKNTINAVNDEKPESKDNKQADRKSQNKQ